MTSLCLRFDDECGCRAETTRRQLCPSHLTVVMSRDQQKPEYNADVAALFTDLKQHAENIVQSDFPRNVRLFDDLLNTDQFAMSTLERLMNDTRAVGLVLNKLLLLNSIWINYIKRI